MLKGVDLSSFQPNVNYNLLKNDGIQFVIFRGGYGNSRDTELAKHVAGAQAAGVPILGIYHFIYVNGLTAAQNAQRCLANARSVGLDPKAIWLFCDIEYDTFDRLGRKANKPECTKYVKEFLDTLKAAGCTKLSIYTNVDYYVNYLDWTTLKDYRDHMWLADWYGGPDLTCAIQQYSSKGSVAGVNGNVDMNYLFEESMLGSAAQTITAAKVHATKNGTVTGTIADGTDIRIIQESGGWGQTINGWLSDKDYVITEGYTEMQLKAFIQQCIAESEKKKQPSAALQNSIKAEMDKAKEMGIWDGSRPWEPETRGEGSVMAIRAVMKALEMLKK